MSNSMIASFVAGIANLMKVGPLHGALSRAQIDHLIIDYSISTSHHGNSLFNELMLPKPEFTIPKTSSSYLEESKNISKSLRSFLAQAKPTILLVYGDLDGIVSACMSALNLRIPVAHVEAGLRNWDLSDTEEFNRVIADRFARLHFTVSELGANNLLAEGTALPTIRVVGNTLIDCLVKHMPLNSIDLLLRKKLPDANYALVTLHKEQNLLSPWRMKSIVEGLRRVQQHTRTIFVTYPTTQRALELLHLDDNLDTMRNLIRIPRQGYVDFLALLKQARIVLTDSSGLQDETTYLGIPCLTLLDVTHRQDTVDWGSNHLISASPDDIEANVLATLNRPISYSRPNEMHALWDGKAAQRIVKDLHSFLSDSL